MKLQGKPVQGYCIHSYGWVHLDAKEIGFLWFWEAGHRKGISSQLGTFRIFGTSSLTATILTQVFAALQVKQFLFDLDQAVNSRSTSNDLVLPCGYSHAKISQTSLPTLAMPRFNKHLGPLNSDVHVSRWRLDYRGAQVHPLLCAVLGVAQPLTAGHRWSGSGNAVAEKDVDGHGQAWAGAHWKQDPGGTALGQLGLHIWEFLKP